MKRLHLHISVNELAESIKFYSILFNASPSVEHHDYAKWDLSEPAVNFAISNRSESSGVNHLGIQVDSNHELKEIKARLNEAEIDFSTQKGVSCCYAHSNKHWTLDPQGVVWESFYTLEEQAVFSADKVANTDDQALLDSTQSDNPKEAPSCVGGKDQATGCCS